MARLLALMLCAVPGLSLGAEPLSMKGLAPGAPSETVAATIPGMRCGAHSCTASFPMDCIGEPPTAKCKTDFMYGDEMPSIWEADIRDGKLTRLMAYGLTTYRFDQLLQSIGARFGKPTGTKVETLQNSFGAKFRSRTVIWQRGEVVLMAIERYGSVEDSAVILSTMAFVRQVEREQRKAAQDKAKNL